MRLFCYVITEKGFLNKALRPESMRNTETDMSQNKTVKEKLL